MKIKVYLCREREKEDIPLPVPRHFVTPLAVCEEAMKVDSKDLPPELVDRVLNTGSLIIDDPVYANKTLGLRINESTYLRLIVEEQGDDS